MRTTYNCKLKELSREPLSLPRQYVLVCRVSLTEALVLLRHDTCAISRAAEQLLGVPREEWLSLMIVRCRKEVV